MSTYELLKNVDINLYQKGSSKLFMKKKLFDILELKREKRLTLCASVIKSVIHGFVERKRYSKVKSSILKLQSIIRMWSSIAELQKLKKDKAATMIRKIWLSYRWSMWLKIGKIVTTHIQRRWRERRVAAVKLQAICRMMIAWSRFRHLRYAIVTLQGKLRIRVAKGILRKLKIEDKNLKKNIKERDHYKSLLLELCEKSDEVRYNNIQFVKNTSNIAVQTDRDVVQTENVYHKLVQKSELLEQQVSDMKIKLDKYKRRVKDHEVVENALGAKMEKILIERDNNMRQIILLKHLVKKLHNKKYKEYYNE